VTPSGIEPATFQFVAQYLNRCPLRYLGTFINSNNVICEEIKLMIAICGSCLHGLGQIFSSGAMSKAVKIKIHKTILQPVVLYGREAWPVTEMYMKRMNT
jgi:hypothetical protein